MAIDVQLSLQFGGTRAILTLYSFGSGLAVSCMLPIYEVRQSGTLLEAAGCIRAAVDKMIAEAEKLGPGA